MPSYGSPSAGSKLSLFKFNRVVKGRPPSYLYDDVVRDQHIDQITGLSVSTEPLRVREAILSDPLFVQILLKDVYRSPDQHKREEAVKYLYTHKLYAQLPKDVGSYRKGEMHRMVSFYTDPDSGVLRPSTSDQFDVVGHPTVSNHWTGMRESQGVPLVLDPGKAQSKTPYIGIPGEDTIWTGSLPSGLKFQYDPVYIYRTRDRAIQADGTLGPWQDYMMWPEHLQCSPEEKQWATDPTKPDQGYVEVVRHPSGVHVNGQGKDYPFYREYTLALRLDSNGRLAYSGRIHGAPIDRIDDTYPITCTNKYGAFTYNWYCEVDDAPPQFSSRFNAGGGPGYRKQRAITSRGQVSDFDLADDGSCDIILEVGMHMDVAVPQMMEGDYTSEAEVDLQMGMEQKVRHFGQTQMWQVYSRVDPRGPWHYDPDGLPEGIIMDPFTGVISGTAARAQEKTQYKILARNNMFRVLEKPEDRAERLRREQQPGGECAFVNENGERVDFRDDGGDSCAIFITVRAVAPEWIGYTYMKAVYSVESRITPNAPIMHGQPSMFLQSFETNRAFDPLMNSQGGGGGGYTNLDQQVSEAKQLPDGLIVDQRTGCIQGTISTPNNRKPVISVDVGRESPFYRKTEMAIERYGDFVEEDLSSSSHGRSPVVLRSECFHKFFVDALTAVNLQNHEDDYLHPLAAKIVIEKSTGRAFIRNTAHVYLRVIDTPPLIHCYNDMHPRYKIGLPIPTNSPQVVAGQGGDVDEFWCPEGSLPEGLQLQRYSGEIVGVPTKITTTIHGEHHRNTEIYARNSGGSCLIRLHITVMDSVPVIEYLVKATNMRDPVQLPVEQSHGLSMSLVDIDLRTQGRSGASRGQGRQRIELYPKVGGCELTAESTSHFRFTMEGHPPAGLSINPRTGEISGEVSGQNYLGVCKQAVRIRCTNTAGSSEDFIVKFTIYGDGAPVPLSVKQNQQRPMKIILVGPQGAGKSMITRVASEATSNIGHVKVGGLSSSAPGSVRPQCTVMRIDHPDGRGGKLHVEVWDAASWLMDPNGPLPSSRNTPAGAAFRGTHPHLESREADGAIIVFSAEHQRFPGGEVNAWFEELATHSNRSHKLCTMLMMNKIDRLRTTSESPAVNIDERIARNFDYNRGVARPQHSQIESEALQYASQRELMFAKTCAIDDKSVDRYDDHRGHTVYAAVNAMAQKIYQIKRNMDFTPNYHKPASPIARAITHATTNSAMVEDYADGCGPGQASGGEKCIIS